MENWDIIAKYLAGEANEKEKAEVEKWISKDSAAADVLKKMSIAVRPQKSQAVDFSENLEEDWDLITSQIAGRQKSQETRMYLGIHLWQKIAASVMIFILAGLGIWLVGRYSQNEQISHQFVVTDSIQSLSLDDGSKVWVNRNSTLTVSKEFGEKDRRVTLTGEAYFEVTKNADKPFIIQTGKVETQVLGTSFNVKEFSDKSVKVTVTEGKVSVSKDTTVYLQKGDAGTYISKSNRLVKEDNKDLNFLSWKTGIIRFEEAKLGHVCEFLSNHYQADIRLKDKSLEDYSITTKINNLSRDQAISIISQTLDLKVQNKDSTIYFEE